MSDTLPVTNPRTGEVDYHVPNHDAAHVAAVASYEPADLVGKQVVAVLNFELKRVAGVKSEVLVLGAVSEDKGVVLLEPSFPVEDGARIG